jgi:M6 family metalloprotease-like protein
MSGKQRFRFSRLVAMVFILVALGSFSAARAAIPQWTEGVLEIAYGDRPGTAPAVVYTLRVDDGRRLTIQPDSERQASFLSRFYGQRIRLNLLQKESLWLVQDVQESTPVAAAKTGAQPWVTILCKFSDKTTTPKPPSYFQGMYSNIYPGLDHYWREQSFNQMNISGSTSVTQWYVLPHARSYYVYDQNGDGVPDLNFDRAANDCTAVADAVIDYRNFVGINLMFNDELDGYAWGGGHYMTLDGTSRIWYMTWEPPWGYANITVIAHEMGHGFGMPHSSGMYGQTYDNRWDVMSDGWTDCANSSDATYGCLGQHTISYHKDLVGWLDGRKTTVSYGNRATITLDRLAQPQSGTMLMVQVPIGLNSNRLYTVEVRKKIGYDVKLPLEGVIIHNVDPERAKPAQVVDIDNNGNTGDAGAVWTVGETFYDATNQISIQIDATSGNGYVITISNYFGAATLTPTLPPTSTPIPTITPTPVTGVAVTRAWTTDNGGNPKTVFTPGEGIHFNAEVVNNTGSAQDIVLRFAVSGPCGTVFDLSYNITTDNGTIIWYLPYTLPTNVCGGNYAYIASVTWNNITSNASTAFSVQSFPTATPPTTETQSFDSKAAQDGWILESGEGTNKGGTLNSTLTTFRLGDNAGDRQFRAILSFDTSSLPDNAVITKVTLKIKLQSVTGTNPFTTHGNLLIDIRNNAFSDNSALQLSDFQSAASKNAVGVISKTAINGWHTKVWTAGVFPYINLAGLTQFRLRFAKDDNDDMGADFLSFYSGNSTAVNRPKLIVEYYVP